MIGWQNPAALWGLLLLAGPVAVHLLRRHRAERVPFPSLRFVQEARSSAIRVQPPTDLVLMFVRAAVVGLAVAAAAGPIVLTAARLSRWTENVARAVVVDASDSMRGAEVAAAAAEASLAELQTAAYRQRVETRHLLDGMARAAAWLATTPPSRREIVVVSDFQRGALDPGRVPGALTILDPSIGVRFVSVGRPLARATFEGAPALGTATVPGQSLSIDITASTTAAVYEQSARESSGVRFIVARDEQGSAERLLDAIARAATPAGASSEPIAIRFAGATQDPGVVEGLRAGWMLEVVRSLGRSTTLAQLVAVSDATDVIRAQAPWVPVLRREDGRPIVSAARVRDELVIDVAARVDTYFAAAVVRAALTSRQAVERYDEREIARVDRQLLASLERNAGPVSGDAWRYAESTDARWCWLGAGALLALEQWLRTRRPRTAFEGVRAAA